MSTALAHTSSSTAPHQAGRFTVPALIADKGEVATQRFLEFFATQIRNANTREAYARACACVDFLSWADAVGARDLSDIQPVHVAAWVEEMARTYSVSSAKQKLAGMQMLFNWLIIGQIIPSNPAAAVEGSKLIVRRGKTPVLTPEEHHQLIESIDADTPAGLHDRTSDEVTLEEVERIRL